MTPHLPPHHVAPPPVYPPVAPLAGCVRVALTRSAEDNQPLLQRLTAAGIAALEWPAAAFVDVPVEPDRQAVEHWLELARAVTFTSRHGVAAWLRQLGAAGLQRPGLVIGAVGEGTADALRSCGVHVGVVAREPSTGATLAQLLADQLLPHKTVLVVQGRFARRELAEGLAHRGLDVRVATVYENAVADPPAIDPALLDASTLIYAAAPSAVARMLQWYPASRQCRWAAIGATTAQALADQGIQAAVICPAPDVDVVAHTLTAALGGRPVA